MKKQNQKQETNQQLKAVMFKGNRNMLIVPIPGAVMQYLAQTHTGTFSGA